MNPCLRDADFTLYNGDALEVLRELPDESVQMCVTSPPFFGLRDYQCEGQIGLEQTPEDWVASLVAVFEQVRRVLRKDGVLFVEVGDSYGRNGGDGSHGPNALVGNTLTAGIQKRMMSVADAKEGLQPAAASASLKAKDLIGQPFLLAFALRDAGWYWRNVCIWHKPNPMPESVRDRFTVSHSYVQLFSKSPRYFFDAEAVREGVNCTPRPETSRHHEGTKSRDERGTGVSAATTLGFNRPELGRNARSVWTIATEPLPFEHYAAFPQALAERCIKAGTSERGCCPECGAPWVREVEKELEATRGKSNRSTRTDLKRDRDTRTEGRDSLGMSKSSKDGSFNDYLTVYGHYNVTTVGWRPSCKCKWEHANGEPKGNDGIQAPTPCTVLDPFLGSGTTALVARRLGRRCIGIELNEKYCHLAAERTKQLSLEAEAVGL